MFQLITIRDTVHIPPHHLDHPVDRALIDQINIKYANKVIAHSGLMICHYDTLTHSDEAIHPISGDIIVHTTFALIAFNPFPSEFITGFITQCDQSGVLVRTDFFQWFIVPHSELQHPCSFDESEQLWVWEYGGHKLYYDLDQTVRIKVLAVEYATDMIAKNRRAAEKVRGGVEMKAVSDGAAPAVAAGDAVSRVTIADCVPAMRVIASMREDGCGLVSWWTD